MLISHKYSALHEEPFRDHSPFWATRNATCEENEHWIVWVVVGEGGFEV